MTRRWLWLLPLTLLALILVGTLALWLSQNLVQRSEEMYTGAGEAARRNPFYTADRLLTRLGRTVHSVRRLDDLPDPPNPADTVLIAIPTYALSAAASQRLLDWVQQGGHALIGVQHEHQPGQGLDHLLNALQVRSHRVESTTSEPVPVLLNQATPPLQVRFQSALLLNDAPWLPLRWGQGRITLLTDLSLFDNRRLADHDHAEFLWALLEQHPGGAIWLQYRLLTPSLAQLLWQHAWMPLSGLILTLLAALWHYSRRLGPVLVPRASEPRRLVDHLQVSSRFLWRHGAGPMLLHAARQYAQRRRAGGPPDPALMDASDQPLTERELVNLLQTLQRLDIRPHE
ncbi:MAG: DUF4350 domain-containing protein [Candidatus Contendobacter sp.]|jgi:hypothetical protein|nr:DUF4350 domain-containing protein [Gammaproteobacteria bacterium]MCC8992455.1 DUF4350 domain-containing protein [Candidatus Contendobacter sp.]